MGTEQRRSREQGRLLALDVGEVRTGLALSDCAHRQASPLKVLDTKALRTSNKSLLDLIVDFEVTRVVVGLPLQADGSLSAQARRVMSLTRQLLIGMDALPQTPDVIFFDESFSSASAKNRAHALGLREREMRGGLDSHAAAEFLQAYLDAPEGAVDIRPDDEEFDNDER